jgi:hypothetical protein
MIYKKTAPETRQERGFVVLLVYFGIGDGDGTATPSEPPPGGQRRRQKSARNGAVAILHDR